MGKKIFWYDCREIKNEETILPFIYNSYFEYLLITSEMYKRINPPSKMTLVIEVSEKKNIKELQKNAVIFSTTKELLYYAHMQGYKTAIYQRIENKDDMDIAWQVVRYIDYLIVELVAETNIPLELLIAKLQNESISLLKVVNNLQEAEIANGVMEIGSDGVILRSEDINKILEFNKYISREQIGKIELTKGTVKEVQHVGMGYRACIDTTNLMQTNEGMIIGSTSSGGLLISSETHYLPYMKLRPFRVNAGAVHSYVWIPDDMTAYLTELKSGSKVLCVNTEGNTREISVGRIKIELRPLLKIEVEAMEIRVNTIVQDDWHIRIFGSDGKPCNASAIKKGDELLTYICHGGRHVGIKIDEMLEEK